MCWMGGVSMLRLKNVTIWGLLVVLMLCFNGIVVKAETYGDFTYSLINYDSTQNEYTEVSITEYNGTATEVTIPSSINNKAVTQIGFNAFSGCSYIKNIVLPDTLEVIQSSAFSGCYNLLSINIPDTVISIGDSAFRECQSLEIISIPNNVSELGINTFYKCTNLKSVILPNNITKIGIQLFYGCGKLDTVVIPEGVTIIENSAFYGCGNLLNIELPQNLKTIKDGAFSGCSSLTSIRIPDNVITIGKDAFKGCAKLENVVLSNKLMAIDDGAFDTSISQNGGYSYLTCELEHISLPESITFIGKNAFCSKTMIYCSDEMSEDENLKDNFCITPSKQTIEEKVGKNLMAYFDAETMSLTYKGTGDFYNDYFTSYNYRTKDLSGDYLTNYKMIEHIKYIDISDTDFTSVSFGGAKQLEDIKLPNTVTNIVSFSGCKNLKKINLHEGITRIGYDCFSQCCSLKEINLPSTLEVISVGAFQGCTGITEVVIPGSVNDLVGDGDHDYVYGAFKDCSNLKKVTLEDGIKSISYGFQGCTSLEQINLPSSIKTVGQAFEGCESLKNVNIPNGVQSLFWTFKNCKSLSNVLIPASVTNISNGQFDSAKGLTICGAKNSYAEEYANQNDIPFVEHTHDTTEIIEAVAPTCTEDGLTEGSRCSVCGGIVNAQTTVKAKGHDIVVDPAVPATCTSDGLSEGSHCSVCNEVLTEQTITKALGHNWDDGTLTKQPTWKENGIITYKCKNCGLTKEIRTATIEAKIEDSINKQIEDKTKVAEEKLSTVETAKTQAEEKASVAETAKMQAEEKTIAVESKVTEAQKKIAELEEKLIKAAIPEKLKAKYKKKKVTVVKPQIISGDLSRLFKAETPVIVCGQ